MCCADPSQIWCAADRRNEVYSLEGLCVKRTSKSRATKATKTVVAISRFFLAGKSEPAVISKNHFPLITADSCSSSSPFCSLHKIRPSLHVGLQQRLASSNRQPYNRQPGDMSHPSADYTRGILRGTARGSRKLKYACLKAAASSTNYWRRSAGFA